MNKAKKRNNTFQAYQEEKQALRESIIHAWVNVARNSRSKYDYLTDLAKAVAAHIAQVEKGKCSASTLLRNRRYKALLLSYMAESTSGMGRQKNPIIFATPVAQMELTHLQLQNSNTQQENKRLKAYIADLETKLGAPKGGVTEPIDQGKNYDKVEETAELLKKYIYTCQTLLLVLERRKDVLNMDREKGQIIDSSMIRGNKIIVDASLAEPFFDWYKSNRASRG